MDGKAATMLWLQTQPPLLADGIFTLWPYLRISLSVLISVSFRCHLRGRRRNRCSAFATPHAVCVAPEQYCLLSRFVTYARFADTHAL